MITIVQCKDTATLRITNDTTYEDVSVMFQNTEDANEMIYRLLRGTMSGHSASE